MEKRWNPNVEISPPCPRCGSSNTKFCYYNNYSLTQPRYFCKGCRRYWTKGGSLRNVPVGGGCRKSRRCNKSFRHGATGIPLSGGVAGGGTVVSLGHNFNGATNPILPESSSVNGCALARAHEEGSNNIDLALVYANFLNQKPWPAGAHEVDDQAAAEPHENHHHHQPEIPVLMPSNIGGGDGSSFRQFSSDESTQMMELMSTNQLSQESVSTFVECRAIPDRPSDAHFSDGDAFYFSGLDSVEKQQVTIRDYQLMNSTTIAVNQMNNYMLPPLPCQELSATFNNEEMWWSSGCNSNHQKLFPSHELHGNQSSSGVVETQDVQQDHHPNGQLDENPSPFNMSIELCNIFRP